MRRFSSVLLAGSLCALLVAGCSSRSMPTSPGHAGTVHGARSLEVAGGPAARGGTNSYPLQLRNRWDYVWQMTSVVLPSGRAGAADAPPPPDPPPPPPPVLERGRFTDQIVCTAALGGHDYLITRRAWDDTTVVRMWIASRQDAAGLYEWDASVMEPRCVGLATRAATAPRRLDDDAHWPAAAARLGVPAGSETWHRAWSRLEAKRAAFGALAGSRGGVAPGELQRLRYPLHTGQAWLVSTNIQLLARVEGRVVLDLPAGRMPCWSVRLSSTFFGPEDVARSYYADAGFAGLKAHFVSEAVDDDGNLIGTLVADETQSLAGYALGGNSR